MTADLDLATEARAKLTALAKRYLWWDGASAPHSSMRAVAQVMNLGTYDDILQLEAFVAPATLTRVMAEAQPGWFSVRAWAFWRGRLAADLPTHPPARSFADAS